MIVSCNEPFHLKDTIRDFKKFTAKQIISQIENEPESRREWMLSLFASAAVNSSKHTKYRFWQEGNHAIELFSENLYGIRSIIFIRIRLRKGMS
jgi:putative transposase